MKNKLLLFLLFFSFLANKINAKNFEQTLNNSKINLQLPLTVNLTDTIKKSNRTSKTAKSTAIIPSPLTTAGSACKEESDLTVRVFMAASGGSGDVIEWFASQTSTTILHTGSIYSPSISQTTTFYVRTHAGADFSVRVPVVASVYSAPPVVNLTVSPTDQIICEGVPLVFTANGGADLFEFSIDGTVAQAMSTDRDFETSTLRKGQVVSVRTRYAVTLDGAMTEAAWGKGLMEDNNLSAALSPNASTGYINGIKISPTENKIVFGIPGKLENNRSMLLFLDTKPGGFNLANYGDEANVIPSVKGFNYFNNNPSTFDSYFQADYCLAISTDNGGTNYFADIIELKTGTSTKLSIGNAIMGFPSSVMGVNTDNSGIADYNLGFEVEVLKSLIGYAIGDIKFFAFTMQDDSELNYNVTNSFLSPELTSSLDYGIGPIDFNIKDPNPVVVSADALIPCYKEDSILVNLDEKPTVATVGSNQFNCTLTSTSLGGNTPIVGSGVWSLKSGPGLVNFSVANSGTSTATVNVEGIYVFTWTISNGICPSSTADITVEFHVPPLTPTGASQTVCATSPIQTLTATATVASGESVVWYDALTGGNVVPDPSLRALGSITYYAESVKNTTLCVSNSRTAVTLTINPIPLVPLSGGDQTVCASSPITPLRATATVQPGEAVVWYDAATGGNVVPDPSLGALGTITYYAEAVNSLTSCVSTSRVAVTLTLNPRPIAPISGGNQTVCATSPIQTLTATATVASGESVVWYDALTGANVVPDPSLSALGSITYYAESVKNATLCVSNSRTAVTLTINPIPLVPLSGGDQTVCASSPITALRATATVQPGEAVVWYDAATGGNVVPDPSLGALGTITYYAEAVNSLTSCVSTSRVAVTLTLNPRPIAPISGGNQTVCATSPIQTLTATATVTSGESVVWYDALTGGNVVPDPSLSALGSITYYAESVKNATLCISNSRTAVTLTINSIPLVPLSGGDQTVCASSPITPLRATATVQPGEAVVWYDTATGGNVVPDPSLGALGTITYYAEAVNSLTSCVSTSRVAVTLTLNPRPIAPISGGNQTVCATSPIQTLTATATVASGESVVWYDALTGGNVVPDPSLSALGSITYYAESVKNITLCISDSRTAVTLTINPIPLVPLSGGDQTVCASSPITPLRATATVQPGESVVWYDAATGGNVVPDPSLSLVGTIIYYAEAVSTTSCVSTSRVAVTLTLNPRPVVPVSGGDQTECTDGTLTQILTATATGDSVTWYTAAVGGSIVTTPTQVGVGTITYYAESSNGICPSLTRTSVTLTIVGVVPNPVATDQTVCSNGIASQTITATALGNTITWYTDLVGGVAVANPTQVGVGTTTYYAESSIGSCLSVSRTRVILTITAIPAIPTAIVTRQPTCANTTGEITITSQSGVEYSVGNGFQDSPIFTLPSGNYTVIVRFKNNTACEISGAARIINPVPPTIQFETIGDCSNKVYTLTANPLSGSYDPNNVSYEWEDKDGNPVGTNSNILNVTDVIASTPGAQVVFPVAYTLTVTSSSTGCTTTASSTVESIYCDIQKGISPDGNGSNDTFDLRLMDVKNLEIFNRYGIKVYNQSDYTDQWNGQSNKGDELPSATYYYVIEFNNGQTKTGWIYLIREK
ncbi:gliding motility-associated C-terminal domain-containing protein [Flavobacterium sp. LB2P84]|uniref:gliding motility-associated C-terminal domain-containing protein n=1 Tax=Flavobacterium yafengii TaxID=3041253 RepID=UPI0024A93572|nr:gliding motility-associated C-terminal domain-containing protein [Flavobacterium yafengii]MDI6034597.1 gliding motility-associated C-terminal domain-containing protein [Flavobacterium yafengii]